MAAKASSSTHLLRPRSVVRRPCYVRADIFSKPAHAGYSLRPVRVLRVFRIRCVSGNDGLRQDSVYQYNDTVASLKAVIQEKEARIQDKDASLKALIQEKDASLKALIQEKDASLKAVEARIQDKEAMMEAIEGMYQRELNEALRQLARHRAVITNRVILELGLRTYLNDYMDAGKFVFTSAWAHFEKHQLQYETGKWDVANANLDSSLHALECGDCLDTIQREFKGFVHTISVPHHQVIDSDDSGLCIGGTHKSQGCVVAIAVLRLQQLGCLAEDIRYLDSDGKDLYLLTEGQVLPPV